MNILGTFQIRNDTAANWTAANPILQISELGFETDTISSGSAGIKIGDGVSTWTSLPYLTLNGRSGPGSGSLRGSQIYVESGPPTTVPGQLNNDLYINSANSYLYQLVAGTWTYQLTLGGGGGGSGTVTSVGLTLPGIFSVSGSPVTTSGTLAASLATQTANTVFAGPTSGIAAAPTFRSLVTADLPALTSSLITDFTTAVNALINFSDEETPTGTMNGSNTAFTLAHTPIAGTLKLYINGIRSQSTDYTVAGTTLTLTNAPLATDNLIVDYRF